MDTYKTTHDMIDKNYLLACDKEPESTKIFQEDRLDHFKYQNQPNQICVKMIWPKNGQTRSRLPFLLHMPPSPWRNMISYRIGKKRNVYTINLLEQGICKQKSLANFLKWVLQEPKYECGYIVDFISYISRLTPWMSLSCRRQ